MDKDKFEAMLAIAEFGAKRMEQRRSTEFQIFISYTTLIVLGLYVIITKHEDVSKIVINASATFCTATGNSGHSLRQDCGIISIYLKGVSDGETQTKKLHSRV